MLSPDRELTPRGRLRSFAIWQLLTLLFAGSVAVAVSALEPNLFGNGHVRGGFLLLLAASILAASVPWEHIGLGARICVPLLDVVAVALLRNGLYPELPSIGLIAVLPIVWMAFDFGWVGMAAAVSSTTFVTCYAYLFELRAPGSGLAWVQALSLPAAVVVLTVVVRVVVLEHQRGELLARSADNVAAMQRIRDHALLREGILETIDVAVLFYDELGCLQLTNHLAEDFAQRAGLILDRPPHVGHAIWHEDKRTPVSPDEQVIPRALAGETIAGVVQRLGPIGDQVAVQWCARRVHHPDGRLLGTVVGWWDVSALVEAVEVRDDFLATVSHELRTPLTSIIGYLEIAQDHVSAMTTSGTEAIGPPGKQLSNTADEPASSARGLERPLATIHRNAVVLLERIALLLAASEARRMKLTTKPADLEDLILNTLVKHRPTADAAEVTLRFSGHATAEVTYAYVGRVVVEVDAARIEQALDNLISNAIKYTPAGGRVAITIQPGDDVVQLHVSDTGVGMSLSEKRQAFDRFFRAESARRAATQGIGLGLTIVKEIIDAHNGNLAVESELGAGTRVTIRLPRNATTSHGTSEH